MSNEAARRLQRVAPNEPLPARRRSALRTLGHRLDPPFLLWEGPVSSVYDFVTFFVLLEWFHGAELFFHTG